MFHVKQPAKHATSNQPTSKHETSKRKTFHVKHHTSGSESRTTAPEYRPSWSRMSSSASPGAMPPGPGPCGSTGLGLAIVQAVVTAHGGRVEVRSRPGRTCFEVLLPLADTKERTDSQTEHRLSTQR